jgi:uncharacterized phage protein gp47/JayE
MTTTYPLPTLAATVGLTGITAPSFNDILLSLQATFQGIYGADAYIGADSQDGQLLGAVASAINDCNSMAVSIYNAFSPQTAVGVGLSSVVKINNITRNVATNSQVNLDIVGIVGTTIIGGQAGDANGNKWNLPASVVIPGSGTITVTATADQLGAINAPISSVNQILTPTAGWQTVNNTTTATPGQPVESDAQLRIRQQISQPLNSNTVLQSLAANLKAIPGVTYGTIYENDTGSVDTNSLPAHSISCVVKGGDAAVIASTIYTKKGNGVTTYGTSSQTIIDISGAVRTIYFSIPTEIPIRVNISISALTGYTSAIGVEIQNQITNFINAFVIGEDLVVNRIYQAALLNGDPLNLTFKITDLQAGPVSGAVGTTDVTIAYTEKATCTPADVHITLV